MTWDNLDVLGLVGRKESDLFFESRLEFAQIILSKAGTAGLALIDHLAIQLYFVGQFCLCYLVISLLCGQAPYGHAINGCILIKMSSLMPGHHANYDDQQRCDNAQRLFRARVHIPQLPYP